MVGLELGNRDWLMGGWAGEAAALTRWLALGWDSLAADWLPRGGVLVRVRGLMGAG